MDRCTAHASSYNAYTAYNAYSAYNPYNVPTMTIMLCRQGRSVRHAQRIAQLDIRRAVRARGGAAALWRQRRGACFRTAYADYPYPYSPDYPDPLCACVFACLCVCVFAGNAFPPLCRRVCVCVTV